MSLQHSPSIVTNGLVLYLDAANPKSYQTTPSTFAVEVLVVAGGGSGGYGEPNPNGGGGGGGGAGGLIYKTSYSTTIGQSCTVTVGAGGLIPTSSSTAGNNGGNSVFDTLTAIGGGAGGGGDFEGTNAGTTGGSGGGAGGDGTYDVTIFSAGTTGQGNRGGIRVGSTNRAGQGGGGAGLPGQSGTVGNNGTGQGGTGGDGLQYSISGTPTYYAGGGGGGSQDFASGTVSSIPGLGGGGAGGGNAAAAAGIANTGGGGGGGYGIAGGAGGSGIVIIRYLGSQQADGGTVTSVGGYTIHTFTTVGSSSFIPRGTWTDLSGNSNNGSLIGAPTYSASVGGNLFLNGTSKYVNFNSITNFPAGATPRTVSLVLKINDSTVNQWIYGLGGRLGTSYNFAIAYNVAGGANCYKFEGYSNDYFTSIAPVIGQTHELTIVYNGSTNVYYYNGVAADQNTLGALNTATLNYRIGTDNNPIPSSYSNINVYNFKIYNRALSVNEVSQNFNALRGRYGI